MAVAARCVVSVFILLSSLSGASAQRTGPPPETVTPDVADKETVGPPIEPLMEPGAPVTVAPSQPAVTQMPPGVPRGPALRLVTLGVAGTPIVTPFYARHCSLDSRNPKDKEAIDALTTYAGPSAILLTSTVDCAGLKAIREDNENGTINVVLYHTLKAADKPVGDRKLFLKAFCDALARAPGHTQLAASLPKDRAQEIYDRGIGSDKPVNSVLETTGRACYSGIAARLDPVKGTKLAMVIAGTVIRGRVILISSASFNGANILQLRARVGRLVEAMSKANGDG